MKIIILAAGKGCRLGGGDLPKPLTPLIGECSILERQIQQFQNVVSLDQIILVVGYQFEKIIQRFPDLLYVYCPHFAQENTSKSLLKALKKVVDEDVLWINGDVVFRESILQNIIAVNKTAMVVNQGVPDEEAVKYRTDGEGRITEISKDVNNSEGEALGINLFKRKDLSLLIENLERCDPEDYFEKGVEKCITQHVAVHAVVVPYPDCVEVDFIEDLAKARKLAELGL